MVPPTPPDAPRAADPPPDPTSGGRAGDPRLWVDEHGDALFRYAMSRVGDRTVAEDLVQETFLAALQAQERFRGAAAPRTWLIGVLRHKVVDHHRLSGRERPLGDREEPESDSLEGVFDARGRWVKRPGRWTPAAPAGEVERREFWEFFRLCADGVAGRAGEAFALRVLSDLSAVDVCKVLDVKATNLWVLLHRARSKIRTCLEQTWFDRRAKDARAC